MVKANSVAVPRPSAVIRCIGTTTLATLTMLCGLNWSTQASCSDPVVNATSLADANPASKRATKKRIEVEPQAEKSALELVDEHLPELSVLLQRLKADNVRQYDLAIRDLSRSAKRLESARNRDEELYELEVELLKSQSNVKILSAKLKVRDSDLDRQALRKAVQRQLDAEIAKADYAVRTLKERAERAQQQLSAATERMQSLHDNSSTQLDKKYATCFVRQDAKIRKLPCDKKNKKTIRERRSRPKTSV